MNHVRSEDPNPLSGMAARVSGGDIMDTYRLSVFARVMEVQNISRVAEEFNLTQPAVSLHIRRLERDMGVRLFERRGRYIVPTEAATALYRYVRAALDVLDEARQHMVDFREGKRGRITVGASTTGVLYYLPPLLRAYKARFPQVDVVLRAEITDRIREAVASDAVDVGFVWGPIADPRVRTQTLGHDTFALVAPPDHPIARYDVVPPRLLTAERFILPVEGSATWQFVESCLRGIGVIPNVAMQLGTTEAIKRAVEAGLGLAVISSKAAEREVSDGTLRALNVEGADFRRPIVIIWRSGATLSPAASALLQMALTFPIVRGASQTGDERVRTSSGG